MNNRNIWLNAIMGIVVGDAFGCPVQFKSREMVSAHPITRMYGYGTFNLPEGSWTDDSSLTLALLDSIYRNKEIDPDEIMENFMKWLDDGDFTPYGTAYDIGSGTIAAIDRYRSTRKWWQCGSNDEWNNGNGSLMRIIPACIYCSIMITRGEYTEQDAVNTIHAVGSLTHGHIRSNIACGLYFFMVHQVLTEEGPFFNILQNGLSNGFTFYEQFLENGGNNKDLLLYSRIKDLTSFASIPENQINSSGYVIDTLEAAIWSLINTCSFDQAIIKAVNLGDDTDTVGAVTGGLAGLYYGYDQIPEDWLSVIKRKDWIEEICIKTSEVFPDSCKAAAPKQQ